MAKGALIEKARGIAGKLADEMGYELYDAAFEKEPAGVYLRIYLEKDGGLSLDDCEKYHRAVQGLLDDIDYDFLEVCSPGLDRPIKTERDARRCLGQKIEIRLYKPLDGRKTYEGIFEGLSEEGYLLDGRLFPKKEVALARLKIDLDEEEK